MPAKAKQLHRFESRSIRTAAKRGQRARPRRLGLEALEPRTMLTGTWTPLTNLPIGVNVLNVLSDGRVMSPRGSGGGGSVILTPDASGNYVNGTWSSAAAMSTSRVYADQFVLQNGRVFVLGGVSGSTNLNAGETYNPPTDTWTAISPFPESTFGNGPAMLLANGTVLAGSVTGPQTYIYDPATNAWSNGPTKLYGDSNNHESWTKLPDGSILSYDVNSNAQHAQRLDPTTMTWIDSGSVPVSLEAGVGAYLNMGPGVLLPDGRVLQLGHSSSTAIYTPSATAGGTGIWVAGPIIPNGLESGGGALGTATDAQYGGSTAAMMPNGHVLFSVDKPDTGGPTKFYEFDPAAPLATSLTDVTPSDANYQTNSWAFTTRMAVLPNGQVLLGNNADGLVYVYTPGGAPQAAWQPTITSVVANGSNYTLTGTQLNGLSAGASYGSSSESASNYPIVELKDGAGHVYFARTSNWTSTGVATGTTPVTTDFSIPVVTPAGAYSLYVIANGIASNPFAFTYAPAFGPSADLTVTSAVSATATQGTNFTFNLTVTNRGFVDAAGVVLTDTLGANLQYASATTGQGSFTQSGGVVTFSLGSIAVGQTVSATVTAQNLGGTLTNSATVSSSVFDADTSNNTAVTSVSAAEANTFLLHSDPGAHQVIYLDFQGFTGRQWGNSTDPIIVTPAFDFNANASTFNNDELDRIQQIWQRVTEDFIPFNVDVTTQDPGTAALMKTSSSDIDYGVRVVVGGDGAWAGGGLGGIAIIGSFTAATDTPCYVFSQALGSNEKNTAEACSHETGHTLGLSHDGLTSPPQTYYAGSGSGPTGWAPIMGVSYNEELSQWSKGEYLNANNTQDDLAIITTNNGFGYRTDDYGNTIATASPLNVSPTGFTGAGIIERNTDVDMFSFSTSGGNIGVTINPAARGPNLDILARLYDATGTLVASSNPVDALGASFEVTAAGQYYLSVTGTGKGDPLNGGYSNYDSLGQYFINVAPNTPPVANAGGSASGSEDSPVTFDASGSYDPDGNALTYTWDFGDGQTATSTSPTMSHTYLWGGTFTVTLTVDDGHGGTANARTSAVVSEVNDIPQANAGGPYLGVKGFAVSFNGSGSSDYDNLDGTSANNQTLVYNWNFGDGTTGTGQTPTHTYATGGNYTVSLTVSDGIASTTSVTSASIATPNANDMYVWDITAATQTKGNKLQASISVVIRRDSSLNGAGGSNDALVASANVTVELRNSSGTLIGTASGSTNSQGTFTSAWFSNLVNGTYVAEVTVLTHKTYTWNKLLDPTPNDTDLDGDNLPDQQFVVGTGAAAAVPSGASDSVSAAPGGRASDSTSIRDAIFANAAGASGTSPADWLAVLSNNVDGTGAEPVADTDSLDALFGLLDSSEHDSLLAGTGKRLHS